MKNNHIRIAIQNVIIQINVISFWYQVLFIQSILSKNKTILCHHEYNMNNIKIWYMVFL
mgnify:CR=1 FL=1